MCACAFLSALAVKDSEKNEENKMRKKEAFSGVFVVIARQTGTMCPSLERESGLAGWPVEIFLATRAIRNYWSSRQWSAAVE